jgi:hypothetical protein
LYKNITPDYYGYRDDDDGILIEKEKRAEVIIVRMTDWDMQGAFTLTNKILN